LLGWTECAITHLIDQESLSLSDFSSIDPDYRSVDHNELLLHGINFLYAKPNFIMRQLYTSGPRYITG
jgi:hypothetical protein